MKSRKKRSLEAKERAVLEPSSTIINEVTKSSNRKPEQSKEATKNQNKVTKTKKSKKSRPIVQNKALDKVGVEVSGSTTVSDTSKLTFLDYKTTPRPINTITDVKKKISHIKVTNVDPDKRYFSKHWRAPKNASLTAEDFTYNNGYFSESEKKLIHDELLRYLAEHGISTNELPYVIHNRTSFTELTGTTEKLYKDHKGLPLKILERTGINRSIRCIHWHLRKNYSLFKIDNDHESQKWTAEDNAKLLRLVAVYGIGNWKQIELALGKEGAQYRYNKLCKDSRPWSRSETKALVDGVQKIMKEDGITDPKQFSQMKRVAQSIKTRTDMECAEKWMKIASKVGSEREWDVEDYLHILSFLIENCSEAQDESEIVWKNVVSLDHSITGEACKYHWKKLRNKMAQVVDLSNFTLSEAFFYCLNNLNSLIGDSTGDWFSELE
ncbi:hypothetical protein BC833DRAFT_621823 [Globomyces pollinis-pini]|nr:hypothetical protein BC833DRAFT_621823 [Globomyces pollinis-pini]